MKHAKRIGALICVIAICFTLMTAPSVHAAGLLGGQAGGAWLAAGLVALNIVAHTGAQAIGSYFGWQEAPSTQSILNYAFPNSSQVISNYMNASTIKVSQGVATIDGVEYDELWLGPEWSQALKTNLFDFKTKWDILSGQTGKLVSGQGYIGGVPIYKVGNEYKSQTFTFSNRGATYTYGDFTTSFPSGNNGATTRAEPSFYWLTNIKYYVDDYPATAYITTNASLTGSSSYLHLTRAAGGPAATQLFDSVNYDRNSFDFDYVSGIVPGQETDIPEDYGISLKIPHDKLETFYNTYPQYNVDNTVINIGQDEVDINELTIAIFDLIESMDEIKAEWTSGEEPEPPVPVDPIDNINENVDTITEYQQNMDSQVSHMHQDVESINQTQQQQLQQEQQQLQQQQQINQNTSNIKDTLENVTETPSSEDLPDFKFDLRELFPFCIPFDIYRLLSSFDATPQAPHVRLPIVIQSIGFNYTLDLDFSAWDPVAQAMRTAELIVYAIGLAWATGKVIKW